MNTQLLVLKRHSRTCPAHRWESGSSAARGAAIWTLLVLVLLALPLGASAAVKLVRQDGSGDFRTVQSAVNAMQSGDVCLIGPGTYDERITFPPGTSGQPGNLTTLRAEQPGAVTIRGFDTANCNFLRLENLNLSTPSATASAISEAGIAIRSTNVEVISNTFNGLKLAISGTANDVVVRANQMLNCGSAMEFSGARWLVDGNRIDSTQKARSTSVSAQILFAGTDHTIRNNHLTAQAGESIDTFPAGLANTEAFQRIVIENNLLEGALGIGISLQGARLDCTNVSIRNNVIAGMHTGAVAATGGVKGIRIYNNTVVNPSSYALRLLDHSTAEVKNNVFYSETSEKAPRQFIYAVDATSQLTLGRNLVCLPNAATNMFPGDLTSSASPFVSLKSRNYRLRPGGSGIDQGTALDSFNTDRDGNSRSKGSSWDVGAYEFAPETASQPEKPGGLRLIVK